MNIKVLIRWSGWIGLGIVLFLISVLLMNWLLQIPAERLPQAYRQMTATLSMGAWIQSILALVIVIYWRTILNYGRVKSIVRKHEHRRLIAARKKVAMILAAYLIVFPIGPVRTLNFISSLY